MEPEVWTYVKGESFWIERRSLQVVRNIWDLGEPELERAQLKSPIKMQPISLETHPVTVLESFDKAATNFLRKQYPCNQLAYKLK